MKPNKTQITSAPDLAALIALWENTNVGCTDCEGARRCTNCTGCPRSIDCSGSTGCPDCDNVDNSTDCIGCTNLGQAHQCVSCVGYSGTSKALKLFRCTGCNNCQRCAFLTGYSGAENMVMDVQLTEVQYNGVWLKILAGLGI